MRKRTLIALVATISGAVGIALIVGRGTGNDATPDEKPSRSDTTTGVTGTIWVANEAGDSLSVIDASRNVVVTTITGLTMPHNVQASPDGKSVWAVGGSAAVVIDARGLQLHGVVPTGKQLAHVVLSPDGRRSYITSGGDDTVSVIDIPTMKAVATVGVGSGPHGLRVSPDGRWVYLANLKGTSLSVIDTTTLRTVADIEVGRSPAQVAFAPNGRFLYASLNGEDAVVKVDVAERRLVDKVEVGIGPIQTYVSPDGRYLLVANQGSPKHPSTTVSIIDTATFKVRQTVETGKGAHGVVIDPSSRFAYITNFYGNDVAVLDLRAKKIIAHIPVGSKPNGISFSPLAISSNPPATIELPLSEVEDGGMPGME